MATKHGSIGEFDSSVEDWTSYTERLQQYFAANDVAEGKQRAVLLSVCGCQTYQLVKNLLAPERPADKTFQEIVLLMKNHYQPKPSIIVERFNFHSRYRKQGESVATFVAELKRLSEHCGFADTLSDMLRDRLVCGINDKRLQRRLLGEADLTFKRAYDLALALEAADRNIQDLSTAGEAKVHATRSWSREQTSGGSPTRCDRCGGSNHSIATCKVPSDVNCFKCKGVGHLANVCRRSDWKGQRRGTGRRPPPNMKQTHQLQCEPTGTALEQVDSDSEYDLFILGSPDNQPIYVSPQVNGVELPMEVDTGATMSIISQGTYLKTWSDADAPRLRATSARLRTYTGEVVKVLGEIRVEVSLGDRVEQLDLLVVEGEGPSLLGRNWLQKLKVDWGQLHQVQSRCELNVILDKHPVLFAEDLGCLKGVQVKIYVDPQVPPKFCRARRVPYALRDRVNEKLEQLKKTGMIEPVRFSEWAAPIVSLVKSSGAIRICGDYKLTANPAARADMYPLPRIEDILASLAGGKLFSKLDLADAYMQIPLDEESKKYTIINTEKGLFRYNRLPFGISAAPAIFQRTMENVLQGIPGVCVYVDDILVTSKNEEGHLRTLDAAMVRLEEAGLRLRRDKCAYLLDSVEYLGHVITAEGLKPSSKNVEAVMAAPVPQDVSQLRSFLGLMNYYGKFLPNLSSRLSPLYDLLHKGIKWQWTELQEAAFQRAKELLVSSDLLVHFDPDKEISICCDASPYGIGAVLAHKEDDGSDRPISYASRFLAVAEKRYSQLDREGLAIIFAVKKFCQFLYGHQFVIYSDHKPLQHIFGANQAVPPLASARIQRWALTLAAYNYTICFKPGKEIGHADGLSRMPLPTTPSTVPVPGETVLMLDTLQMSPVNAARVKLWTDQDPILSDLWQFLLSGSPTVKGEEFAPYLRRQEELTLQNGCISRGNRVLIPSAGEKAVLELLHSGHPGISRMKSIARSSVWWPLMDQHLEAKVKECSQCQLTRNSPPPAPAHLWEWPQRPWARIHVDYAGPFLNKMFLIVVDAHSKWMDVVIVNSATSTVTIEKLRAMFAVHGLPETLVSDNGTVFTSAEFKEFLQRNNIQHIRTAPYHPVSNGQAERAVQTFKNGMKRSSKDTLETRVSRFLFHYRITPNTTTGVSPAELLMGRSLRSHFSMLHPAVEARVASSQRRQKEGHDKKAKKREFQVGDLVYVRDLPAKTSWLVGTITGWRGLLSFLIELNDGRTVHRHVDHIRQRVESQVAGEEEDAGEIDIPTGSGEIDVPTSPTGTEEAQHGAGITEVEQPPRRSIRERKPPDVFDPCTYRGMGASD